MEAMAEKPSKIAAKLRWLMELGNLTQAALADIAGVHPTSVGNYMGKAVPGPAVLLKIARHFKVPLEWLIDDEQGVEDFSDAAIAALARYPDDKIIGFLSQRWAATCEQLVEQLDKADKIDWAKIASELSEITEKAKQEGKPRPLTSLEGTTIKAPANLPKHLVAVLELALAVFPLAGSTIGRFEILQQWGDYSKQLHERHKGVAAKISKATEVVGFMMMQMVRVPKK